MVSVPGMLGRTGVQTSREILHGKGWNEVISVSQAALGHFAAFSSRAALLSGAMESASEPEQDAPRERS